jgi:ribonuclease Z
MKTTKKTMSEGLTRREALKLSGLALGGLAFGGALAGPGAGTARAQSCPTAPCYPTEFLKTQRYTYGPSDPFIPGTKIGSNEMRITFLGSMFPPPRRANQEMSIFVEVGDAKGEADQFVFDCGSGVCSNYDAMLIGYGKMDKVFISHLHGDHMSDLTHIYCFGPSGDRKSPLYVWGPSPSGVRSPKFPYRLYDDGTNAYCRHLREAMRWHTESFSFQTTSYASYQPPTRQSWGLPVHPIPVGDDSRDEGYALVPIQLDWRKYGKVPGDNVAYNNPKTGVKITHFPVIHTRKGSIGYKLEWNGLSMIYTSDTRPETHCIEQAKNGN